MTVSTYVLTDGGNTIVQYPWSLDQMIMSNPTVSFTVPVSNEIAAQFNTFPVIDTPQPTYNPLWQNLTLVYPVKQDGVWVQQWSVTDMTPDEHDAAMANYRGSLFCSPLQGKIELDNRGLLDSAEAIVASADKITRLAWANATVWIRTSPMIVTIGTELGLTPDDLDDLFVQAAKITV